MRSINFEIDGKIKEVLSKGTHTFSEILDHCGTAYPEEKVRHRINHLVETHVLEQKSDDDGTIRFGIKKSATEVKSRERQLGAILLVGSIIVCLVLGEVAIRVFYSVTGDTIGADEYEKCTRVQYDILENPSTQLRYHPSHLQQYEYWNYSGVIPSANYARDIPLQFNDGRRAIMYYDHFNGQHMRAFREYSVDKPNDTIRIALLGDSFAYGADVPLKFSISYLMEQMIPDSEVLNMGIEGTGIGNMFLRWKHDALNYKPDIVLYTTLIDDVKRIRPCIYKPIFNVVDGKIELDNFPPPSLQEIHVNMQIPVFESYLVKHLLYTVRNLGGVDRNQFAYGLERFGPILDEMKARSEADGTYLMVPIIRHPENQLLNDDFLWALDEMKKILDEKGIPYVDSAEIFADTPYDPKDYYGGPNAHYAQEGASIHYKPEGYAYYTQGIVDQLVADGVIDPVDRYDFQANTQIHAMAFINKANQSDVDIVTAYDFVEVN